MNFFASSGLRSGPVSGTQKRGGGSEGRRHSFKRCWGLCLSCLGTMRSSYEVGDQKLGPYFQRGLLCSGTVSGGGSMVYLVVEVR